MTLTHTLIHIIDYSMSKKNVALMSFSFLLVCLPVFFVYLPLSAPLMYPQWRHWRSCSFKKVIGKARHNMSSRICFPTIVYCLLFTVVCHLQLGNLLCHRGCNLSFQFPSGYKWRHHWSHTHTHTQYLRSWSRQNVWTSGSIRRLWSGKNACHRIRLADHFI